MDYSMSDYLDDVTKEAKKAPVDALVRLPRTLTAENGAKALLIGEFYETAQISCPECAGDEDWGPCHSCNNHGVINQRVTIEWTTIKEIYKRIVEHLAI
jgi:hypothetical protein